MCYNGNHGFNDPHHCFPDGFPGQMENMIRMMQSYMPYDLEETDTNYYLSMPLPGFSVKDINVSVKGNIILIEAKNPTESEQQDEDIEKRKLVNWGTLIWKRDIEVKVPVDNEIDTEKVKAKLSKGILRIKFQKIPGKKIDIEGSS